jgi:site-specific DNA recombinase
MPTTEPIERRVVRCAIYTRKSTGYGLDAAVNSLETQRDVCQSYIKCQAHRNWTELSSRYDDGGYSGGTLARPALTRLVRDIEEGRLDVVVIYKIDRLTRSLLDFVRLTEVLEKYGVNFVSVTQAFDTSDSMGRLVLNVLLTFAQFERELSSDRVRDKKAAMRKNGLFAGGLPPFGYLVEKGGRLIVDAARAPIVAWIFEQYPKLGSVRELVTELRDRGCVTRRWQTQSGKFRGGQPITAAVVRQILTNPIYVGSFVHRGEWIKAKNEALVTRDQWDLVQAIRLKRTIIRNPDRDFLVGILHDEFGRRMSMTTSAPGYGHKPRYYRAMRRGTDGDSHKAVIVDAPKLELLAKSALKAFLVDDSKLREAVLSLGLYSDVIARLLRKGRMASRRIDLMEGAHVRRLFLALVPRAEVTKTELRLYVSCYELSRFLAWDGKGLFTKASTGSGGNEDRVYLLVSQSDAMCGKRTYMLPVQSCQPGAGRPKPWLVELLSKAAQLEAFVLANRGRSISELAKAKHLGPSQLSRYVRANYLAPDIKAAIMDGTEPPGLTAWSILYGPLPLDWALQRQLYNFPDRSPRGGQHRSSSGVSAC